jgi:hypothetical protein
MCHDKGGCHENTRSTDGSGADPLERRGLCTNRTVLRQGQSPAATAGCYQRLGVSFGGTGHCAGPFLFWSDLGARKESQQAEAGQR